MIGNISEAFKEKAEEKCTFWESNFEWKLLTVIPTKNVEHKVKFSGTATASILNYMYNSSVNILHGYIHIAT